MILKRKQAIRSILEQADHISEDSPDSAIRFIEAARRSLFPPRKKSRDGSPVPIREQKTGGCKSMEDLRV